MGEKIDSLRLSVTDRCNLNCIYCTPLKKSKFLSKGEVLRYEEMVKLVYLFVKAGIRKVRITGGEPLIKKDIITLIKMLRGIEGIEDVSMTTNGVYLESLAGQLKEAGLNRVNVSLDTLKRERFKNITGSDSFDDVWNGIKEALNIGLYPVKLNVILMRGINDEEMLDFVRLTFRYPLIVRFIELYPTNERSERLTAYLVTNYEVMEKISNHFGKVQWISGIKGNGPAQYYRLKDAEGTVGFISGFSENFCNGCNRIRVDCAGRISLCLFSGYVSEMREQLRSGEDEEYLLSCIRELLSKKSQYKKNITNRCKIEMSSIGG